MQQAIERSVAPPPFYFHLVTADHLINEEWTEMLAAAERASADGSSFGQAMLAIAHSKLSNVEAARQALDRMAELDPGLADDPRAWLEAHSFHSVIVDPMVAGLSEASSAVSN